MKRTRSDCSDEGTAQQYGAEQEAALEEGESSQAPKRGRWVHMDEKFVRQWEQDGEQVDVYRYENRSGNRQYRIRSPAYDNIQDAREFAAKDLKQREVRNALHNQNNAERSAQAAAARTQKKAAAARRGAARAAARPFAPRAAAGRNNASAPRALGGLLSLPVTASHVSAADAGATAAPLPLPPSPPPPAQATAAAATAAADTPSSSLCWQQQPSHSRRMRQPQFDPEPQAAAEDASDEESAGGEPDQPCYYRSSGGSRAAFGSLQTTTRGKAWGSELPKTSCEPGMDENWPLPETCTGTPQRPLYGCGMSVARALKTPTTPTATTAPEIGAHRPPASSPLLASTPGRPPRPSPLQKLRSVWQYLGSGFGLNLGSVKKAPAHSDAEGLTSVPAAFAHSPEATGYQPPTLRTTKETHQLRVQQGSVNTATVVKAYASWLHEGQKLTIRLNKGGLLGAGGSCGVYLAQLLQTSADSASMHEVAAKVLFREPVKPNSPPSAQYLSELASLRVLRHFDQFIQLLAEAAVEIGGKLYRCLVLDLAVRSVAQQLKAEGPMTQQDAKHLARFVLQCLVVMATQLPGVRMLHGDLKCANILLNQDGGFVMADTTSSGITRRLRTMQQQQQQLLQGKAGLAVQQQGDTEEKEDRDCYSCITGTPAFTSPELAVALLAAMEQEETAQQAGAQGAAATAGDCSSAHPAAVQYDNRVDTFAVGVMMLEALVGGVAKMLPEPPAGAKKNSAAHIRLFHNQLKLFVSDCSSSQLSGVWQREEVLAARDFIRCCSAWDPSQRWSPHKLLEQHPWLQ